MRILQIDKFLGCSAGVAGGTGSYIDELQRHLRSRGHEVLQFGCAGEGDSADRPGFFDFTATRSPLALWRMIHNTEAANKLSAMLRREPVDVAHLHNIYHHLSPSILPVLARWRIGIVMTMHDYRLFCPTKHFLRPDGVCMRCRPHRFYRAASPRCAGWAGLGAAIETYVQRITRRYFRHVDRFLCPTEFMARLLREAGAPAGKITLVRNYVSLPAENLSEPGGMATPSGVAMRNPEQMLLFAGRLSAEKAPGLCLDLAGELPDVKIILAGEGPLLDQLRQRVTAEKLTNVELPGHVSKAELDKLIARATAVILPSRWIENSPAAMLEPMAAGRCVIAADHAPLREWIIDGQTGRLFCPADGEDFARVCREVLADAPARQRIAQAGQSLVLRRHNPTRLTDQIEEIYRRSYSGLANWVL